MLNDRLFANVSKPRPSSPSLDDSVPTREVKPSIFATPESLAIDLKSIYGELVAAEFKRITFMRDTQLGHEPHKDRLAPIGVEGLGKRTGLQRTMLYHQHDLKTIIHHPCATDALQALVSKYSMPARLWRHVIHDYLELLRRYRSKIQGFMVPFYHICDLISREVLPAFRSFKRAMSTLENTHEEFARQVSENFQDLGLRESNAIQSNPSPRALSEENSSVSRLNEPRQKLSPIQACGLAYGLLALRGPLFRVKSMVDECLKGNHQTASVDTEAEASSIYSNNLPQTLSFEGNRRQRSTRAESFYRMDLVVDGCLNGKNETALVDTGAEANFISRDYLLHRRIDFDCHRTTRIMRADSSYFNTLGTVTLPWQFSDATPPQSVEFHVALPEFCAKLVTFGARFMHRTSIALTDFARRIPRTRRNSFRPRTFFQGGDHLRLTGYCNGIPVHAVPDSGSDIPLMSRKFARMLEKRIENGPEYRVKLELPGNHICHTQGMVRGVEWEFSSGEKQILDFYVLDGLPVDVLLDDQFLEDNDVFNTHCDSLFEVDNDDAESIEQPYFYVALRKRWASLFRRKKIPDTHKDDMSELNKILDEVQAARDNLIGQERQDKLAELDAKFKRLKSSGNVSDRSMRTNNIPVLPSPVRPP